MNNGQMTVIKADVIRTPEVQEEATDHGVYRHPGGGDAGEGAWRFALVCGVDRKGHDCPGAQSRGEDNRAGWLNFDPCP